MFIHTYMYTYVCACVHICICTFAHMCICINLRCVCRNFRYMYVCTYKLDINITKWPSSKVVFFLGHI